VSTIVEFRGPFRLMASEGIRLRAASRGTWYCRCGEIADSEHTNPRCDTCRSGGECGSDCTLSRLWCLKCGATL
jgi:hypothetical protein